MKNSINGRRNAARASRLQERLDSGLLAQHFPEVEGVVVNMTYKQKGIAKSLLRTVHFSPDSYALFRVDCLSKECTDGGFDLTKVITGMIAGRKKAAKGELDCQSDASPSGHSAIVYEVTVQYKP